MDASRLEGAELDRAVCIALGMPAQVVDAMALGPNPYSTEWNLGGPIIERERISIKYDREDGCWLAWSSVPNTMGESGPTPLIAAMRAFCASRA